MLNQKNIYIHNITKGSKESFFSSSRAVPIYLHTPRPDISVKNILFWKKIDFRDVVQSIS